MIVGNSALMDALYAIRQASVVQLAGPSWYSATRTYKSSSVAAVMRWYDPSAFGY